MCVGAYACQCGAQQGDAVTQRKGGDEPHHIFEVGQKEDHTK